MSTLTVYASSPARLALATVEALETAYSRPGVIVDVIHAGVISASYRCDSQDRLHVMSHRIGCRPMSFDYTELPSARLTVA